MGSTRHRYLDVLKVIAIFFVCMYHFGRGSQIEGHVFFGYVQNYFYAILSTCVPLFFAVNGALLLNKEAYDANKHFKKLLLILLQYYIWHGITAVILGISAGLDFLQMNKHQLINIFLFLETPDGVDLDHFWFIATLCGIYVIYPFLTSMFTREHQDHNARKTVLFLGIVLYFLCFFIQDFAAMRAVSPYLLYLNMDPLQLFNPFGMRIATMLTYFLIGGFLHKYREKYQRLPAAICVLMILTGLLLSYASVIFRAWQGDVHYDVVFGGYNTTGTLLCTVGIFLLASKAEEKTLTKGGAVLSAIQHISCNTLTIYYTHWIIGYLLLPKLPIGYGCFWNLLKAGLFVISGTLLGEGMRRIPVVKYLVH